MFDTFEVQRMSKHFSRDFGSNPYIFTPSIILEAGTLPPSPSPSRFVDPKSPNQKKPKKMPTFSEKINLDPVIRRFRPPKGEGVWVNFIASLYLSQKLYFSNMCHWSSGTGQTEGSHRRKVRIHVFMFGTRSSNQKFLVPYCAGFFSI